MAQGRLKHPHEGEAQGSRARSLTRTPVFLRPIYSRPPRSPLLPSGPYPQSTSTLARPPFPLHKPTPSILTGLSTVTQVNFPAEWIRFSPSFPRTSCTYAEMTFAASERESSGAGESAVVWNDSEQGSPPSHFIVISRTTLLPLLRHRPRPSEVSLHLCLTGRRPQSALIRPAKNVGLIGFLPWSDLL